ncbi:MAG: hypothetical protein Q9169_001738 [Polycauliona sp. 2 TL-2023]
MATPSAKRICRETVQDMPADPTTPIDDFDDLYEDSPAIDRYQEKSPQLSSEEVTGQQSIPKLQSTSFQLPGLGLFTSKENNADTEADLGEQLCAPDDTSSIPLAGDVHLPQSSLWPERESLQEPPQTKEGHEDAPTVSSSVKESYQLQGPEPIDTLALEVSPQGQTATEERTGAEGFRVKATSELVEQRVAIERTSAGHSADAIQTLQKAIEVTGPEPQKPHDTVAPSKDSDLAEQRSHREIENAEVRRRFMGQQDLDGIAYTEPAIQKEDEIASAAQRPKCLVQNGITAGQQVDESAPQLMQDNAKGDLPQLVETAMALSGHSGVDQATPAPQVDLKEAAQGGREQTFEQVAEANTGDGEAEFELDSSPIESSSESDSDSSSSSSGDSDYEMLDPEEEARRLMQEDGGSDDEGKGGKAPSGPLRTLNEKPDEVIPKPQVEITPEMIITELGSVEHVVENSILIKGKTSGESRALESGSLLCLQDRSVVGVVAELLGQVHQPYYSVRFTNPAAITEAGISKGISIFYVEQHSSYVFTQSLKALKGSDASNIHDEEVGADELEFSDDEAEAEHKRRVKQERQARRGDRNERSDRGTRGAPSPTTPSIPAGAHINPAFFAQAWPQQQQTYSNSNAGGGGDRSPQSAEAFKAAQDRLDLLRQLTRNAGAPG